MNNAKILFNEEIDRIKSLSKIVECLRISQYSNEEHYEELNRLKLVWGLSAFDRLLHDLIREGVMEIFVGKRNPTQKYRGETIPISIMIDIYNKDLIPASEDFKTAIYTKLKTISYQSPEKIADGLSFIWDEKQKWKKLADKFGNITDKDIKSRLTLITTRRNFIVHEADRNPVTLEKYPLTDDEVNSNVIFLEKLGNAICDCVIVDC